MGILSYTLHIFLGYKLMCFTDYRKFKCAFISQISRPQANSRK